MQQLSVSFLLFAFTASALFLFALGAADFSQFDQLLDLELFLDGGLGNPFLPLLFDLVLPELFGLAFHTVFFSLGVLFQIELVQTLIFILHQLALTPLFKPLSVEALLVAQEGLLNSADLQGKNSNSN